MGHTPLHWAARDDSIECLALLLSNGAEINKNDMVRNGNNMNWYRVYEWLTYDYDFNKSRNTLR